MKNSLKAKIEKLPQEMYFTTNNPDPQNENFSKCKYFILFHNTRKIAAATTTQATLEYHVNDILKNGYYLGNRKFI
jgi:hypothetical protein